MPAIAALSGPAGVEHLALAVVGRLDPPAVAQLDSAVAAFQAQLILALDAPSATSSVRLGTLNPC
jgi:hypothetical protein